MSKNWKGWPTDRGLDFDVALEINYCIMRRSPPRTRKQKRQYAWPKPPELLRTPLELSKNADVLGMHAKKNSVNDKVSPSMSKDEQSIVNHGNDHDRYGSTRTVIALIGVQKWMSMRYPLVSSPSVFMEYFHNNANSFQMIWHIQRRGTRKRQEIQVWTEKKTRNYVGVRAGRWRLMMYLCFCYAGWCDSLEF